MTLNRYWRRAAYPFGPLPNINTAFGNPAYRIASQAATRSSADVLLRTRFKMHFEVSVVHGSGLPESWWDRTLIQPIASFAQTIPAADPVLSSGSEAVVGVDLLPMRLTRTVDPTVNDYYVTWDSLDWVDVHGMRKGNPASTVKPMVNVGLWVYDPTPALQDFPQYSIAITGYLYLQTLWGSPVTG